MRKKYSEFVQAFHRLHPSELYAVSEQLNTQIEKRFLDRGALDNADVAYSLVLAFRHLGNEKK